ncbi:Bromodomain containing protein [Gracilaria domingensis]|nr:Bromodomain containing protein [Gracilaria domingensis]
MVDNGDVRLQLDDLEAEEARIMRELREMDEKAEAEKAASSRRADQIREDPEAALAALLLECEKEVRDAKGYIADQGPPLKIVRLKHGETGPRSATYLSRPRNTGVDFTVPVTLKAYTDLIKHPIFLNQIREKIKARKYRSIDDYLDDMRLLVRNTAQFNKGADLAWVVQHARFLLEAAEDAIQSRRHSFHQIEQQLQHAMPSKPSKSNQGALAAVGKRKRTQSAEKTNGDVVSIPPVGSSIEIYWHPYRKWYVAYITEREGSSVNVRYQEDNSEQVVDLNRERWRMRSTRSATRPKRVTEPASKRRKGAAAVEKAQTEPVMAAPGLTHEDLDSIKIDLFAKFEDLRDSVNEQLKQHLDRVDRAIVRSDALTRILVQLGDTQNSVETALTTMFDKFEKLEQKFESVLQSHEQSHNQGGTREMKVIENPKQRDVEEKQNREQVLEGAVKTDDATKREGDPPKIEEGQSAPKAADVNLAEEEDMDATGPAIVEKQVKETEDKTTPILISDDEDSKVIDKADASPDGKEKMSRSEDDKDVPEREEILPKEGSVRADPCPDRMSESDKEDEMDVDEVPNADEKPSPHQQKAEKSPVIRASRKVVSADTGTTEIQAQTVSSEKNEEAKTREASEDGASSGSSSGSEESEESESDEEKRTDADTKAKTALKEPRKPKPSRFANRADVEKKVDGAESRGAEEKEDELHLNQENGVSEDKEVHKDNVDQPNTGEAEGSTNVIQGDPVVAKDKDEMKSGDT